MIEKNKVRQDYFSINSLINDCKKQTKEENPTAEQVLEFMIVDENSWSGGDYVVYKYESRSKRSFLNRLNLCWVYPLILISIPFQYLLFGSVGVNRNTRLGSIVDKLVKFT